MKCNKYIRSRSLTPFLFKITNKLVLINLNKNSAHERDRMYNIMVNIY